MSYITINDMLMDTSQKLTYCDAIPYPTPNTAIMDSELMLGESVPLESEIMESTLPNVETIMTRLAAFENRSTMPLCIMPPTQHCRKRFRDNTKEHDETKPSPSSSSKAPRGTEEWMSWLDYKLLA
tara:strand:- start:354 stop:731 length:378 start_codon:yes stop_codon:yes gene_type:complete